MPADLPPTAALADTVNEVTADLGVTRPALLDDVDHLADASLTGAGCLHLDLDDEVALALHVDVKA